MVSEVLSGIEQKMKVTIDGLGKDLGTIRTGRATPALLDNVRVEYSGVPTPLKQLASISAPQARLLIVQPWDRGSLGNIEKAILKSDLGLNPTNDGNVLRLVIPPLNEERRQELMKLVRRRVEERKVAIRNLRQDAMKDLRNMERRREISQDDLKRSLDQLQRITDTFIANVDKVGRSKEAELAEV